MVVIGIVDDEPVWLEKIADCINNFYKIIKQKDYRIYTYKNGNELISAGIKPDLIFLDIDLKNDEDGFQIAEKIHSIGVECKICFLTSHIEFARMGYKVNAFRYIDKLHLEEIDEALGSYISAIAKSKYIECKDEFNRIISVNVADAIFIETSKRKLGINYAGGSKYYYDGNIGVVALQYEDLGLIQVQRSYIVNMRYIRNYDSRNITMIDGTIIPISRDRIKSFKLAYFNWRRLQV